VHRENYTIRSFIIYNLQQILVHQSRRMRWVEYVERTEEMKNAYKILDVKPEGTINGGLL